VTKLATQNLLHRLIDKQCHTFYYSHVHVVLFGVRTIVEIVHQQI